jgi:hypothetical protein
MGDEIGETLQLVGVTQLRFSYPGEAETKKNWSTFLHRDYLTPEEHRLID